MRMMSARQLVATMFLTIFRMGQRKKVFVYRFTVEGSIESQLGSLIAMKLGLQRSILADLDDGQHSMPGCSWHKYMGPPQLVVREGPLNGDFRGGDAVIEEVADK